jgi:hypothetical protein
MVTGVAETPLTTIDAARVRQQLSALDCAGPTEPERPFRVRQHWTVPARRSPGQPGRADGDSARGRWAQADPQRGSPSASGPGAGIRVTEGLA